MAISAASTTGGSAYAKAPTDRVRLARVALESALSAKGVAGGEAGVGRLWATDDRGELLKGVLAVARPDARVDLELHLVGAWPLPPLAGLSEEIRKRVERAASAAGLGDRIGSLSISFEDVLEPASLEPEA